MSVSTLEGRDDAPPRSDWSCPNCYRDWPAETFQAAARCCDECGYREAAG